MAGIQKSSRTRTTALEPSTVTMPQACTSCVSCSPRRACSHCSNWSSTTQTLVLLGHPRAFANSGQHIGQRQFIGNRRRSAVAVL